MPCLSVVYVLWFNLLRVLRMLQCACLRSFVQLWVSQALAQNSTARQRIICQKRAATARHKTRTGSIYLDVDRGTTLEGSKKVKLECTKSAASFLCCFLSHLKQKGKHQVHLFAPFICFPTFWAHKMLSTNIAFIERHRKYLKFCQCSRSRAVPVQYLYSSEAIQYDHSKYLFH